MDDDDGDLTPGGEEEEETNDKDILKMVYIYYKEKKSNKDNYDTTYQLINYFKNYKDCKKGLLEANQDFIINEIDKNDKKIIDNLKDIIGKLEKTKAFKKTIQNFKSDIDELQDQNQNLIYIPFLGPSNSGKSTFLNAIIGNNLLPVELGECTKKGIIISYSGDNEPDISIRNAILKSKGNKKYYFEYDKNIIARGFPKVREVLRSLNFEFTKKEENCFYNIRTKIKLFDEIKISEYLKKKIFLIDFPGYGTKNTLETQIFPKIFEFCHCYTFTVRDSSIYEKENQIVLNNALEAIKVSKDKFTDNGFIKSCLFIYNIFDKSKNDNDEDI